MPIRKPLCFIWMLLAPWAWSGGVVMFNEIMYNPADDAQEREFVELYNTLCYDMDLSLWQLDGGIEFTFPVGTIIPAEGYLVVAKSPAALESSAGITGALGPYNGQLANGGESIRLENSSGRVMDEMTYGDGGLWPVAPDGSGGSLAKMDPNTASATASSWHSGGVGGTPGNVNFGESAGTVVQSELIAKTATWKYRDLGTDPGSSWMIPSYDDGSWSSGPAVLGYGDAWTVTTVSYGSDSANKYPTTYFRHRFSVSDPTAFSSLQFSAMMDDGAILYLNGTEFARVRVDAGTITYLDYSNDSISGAEENVYEPLTLPPGLLVAGDNILAAEVHNQSGSSSDLAFSAELVGVQEQSATESTAALLDPPKLVINEMAGVTNAAWWLELRNTTDAPLDPAGYVISAPGSPVRQYLLPAQSIPAGGYLVLTAGQLGFGVHDEEPLFLYRPGAQSVADARVAKRAPRGRLGSEWLVPSAPTPGADNLFALNGDIVINEIMYHHQATNDGGGYAESDVEWIELYNRGSGPVDLSGWKFDAGINHGFSAGTSLAPGGYLVVSNFSGALANDGERLCLVDAAGNPADEVRYFDGGRWPARADGGGSSLELRDPFADNSLPEAWAASDESGKSGWRVYSYQVPAAASSVGPDSQWREFVMGLLSAGEVLLDDISVIEDPGGADTELIATSDFESGMGGWRIIGTHRHSEVITDPDNAGNHVLRLVATGPTEHMHNHAEITLADGQSVENGTLYRISFRAKWIGGSRLLNTRLYFNRTPKTHLLDAPMNNGTPGMRNSMSEANIGPTFDRMRHDPAVPNAGESVQVSIRATDPQGVAAAVIRYSVDGGTWQQAAMTDSGDGLFTGTIPGQAFSSLVQFYVEAEDGLGAVSAFPAAGAAARAMYEVNDGYSDPNLHNFRIIMTAADSSFMHADVQSMSNENMPCTVISRDRDIYYNVGVHLKGALGGRTSDLKTGYRIGFNADQLFNGVLDTVSVDKSSLNDLSRMPETLTFLTMNRAGSRVTKYNDWIKLIAPDSDRNYAAQLQLGHYSDVMLDGQFEAGSDGNLFEFEYVYYQVATNADGFKISSGRGHTEKSMEAYSGTDKEDYRHTFLIKNNRAADDYAGLMEFVEVMGSAGSAFSSRIGSVADVDEWLRAFAYAVANSCGDNFAIGSYHNAYFYRRPSDGRFLYMPHDMDQYHDSSRPLVSGNAYLQKMIAADPGWERLYYAHMRDILDTAWNTAYMQRWTDQFSNLIPGAASRFSGYLSFFGARHDYLSGQLATRVAPAYPFAVTSGSQTVDTPTAVVTGDGWLDVHAVYLDGQDSPLPLTWTASGTGTTRTYSWAATVPLDPGLNNLTFLAYDYRGNLIGSHSVTITSTAAANPLREHLRITELMVNPVGGGDYEFIELHNTGSELLDLSGVRFAAGIDFDFSAAGFTLLGAGQTCVLAANLPAFATRYDTNTMILAGEYSGKLANEGETVEILGPLNGEILRFTYGSGRGWPLAAEGAGHALVPLAGAVDAEPDGSLYHGRNWRAGNNIGGSPGLQETAEVSAIRLNEITAHTDFSHPSYPEYDSNDRIELHNSSGMGVVLGEGLYLSDDAAQLGKWAIPADTGIAPQGHVYFDEISGFHNPITNGFGLDKAGEQVFLSYLPAGGTPRVVDAVRFKGQENGASLGRYGDGGAFWYALTPSDGAPNSLPAQHPAISEIMYHPPDSPTNNVRDEYLEICNPTALPVELWNSAGAWRIDGGIGYIFPSNTVLEAGAALVLVTFDPSDSAARDGFLSAYGLTNGQVTLLGPVSDQLDNRGERVALERPQAGDLPGDPVSWVIVDEVIYFHQAPWPEGTDGSGRSLQRKFTRWSGNDPESWYASFTPSPGRLAETYGDHAVPDWWLAARIPGATNDFSFAAVDDPDGDTLATGAEYVAGTEPLFSESCLRTAVETGTVVFATIPAGPEYNGFERHYALQYTHSLADGIYADVPGHQDIPADGAIHVLPIPVDGADAAFFKVEAGLR